MSWFANLKLNTKFNLILSALLFGLFALTAILTFRDQQDLVVKMALEQGRGVARQIIATTDYMSSVVGAEAEQNYSLVPQVVATQVAKKISAGNSYSVRQISLEFRNPENRPDSYETGQLKAFARTPANESYQVVRENGRDLFRYMQPMVAEQSCLECHGAYDDAPVFIQQRYPREHPSYGYRIGQVVGAVSVLRPMADLSREVGANLKQELVYRLGTMILVFAVMAALIRRLMITPIHQASTTIHRVTSTGNLSERIPPLASHDEVGRLIGDFNEMMETLDRTTLQRQESEDRYRNLIEAADSAILTFLENGKIVISNQLAEKLLGISRDRILGETIFDYLEQDEPLRDRIAAIASGKRGYESEKGSRYRLLIQSGRPVDVEVTLLLASRTDHTPMFTAIIKKVAG